MFSSHIVTVDQTGIPDLWHFMYKSRSTAQFTSPEIGAPYLTAEDRERYFFNIHFVLGGSGKCFMFQEH